MIQGTILKPYGTMQINLEAPVTAQHEILICAPIEKIWQILSDIARWSIWNPAISQAKLEGPLAPGSVFRWKSGGTAIVSTLQEVTPYHRLSWTGKAVGTQAVHVWILEKEGGVVVATEESFEGWMVHLLKGMMQPMLDTSLQAWLKQLKQKAEEID